MSNSRQLANPWFTVTIALCLLFVPPSKAHSQQFVQPENQEISLRGTIRLVHGFGPPGYGEDPRHDARVAYWALELKIPVNTTHCTPSKPENEKVECGWAKRLNLFFEGSGSMKLSELPAAKWKDHQVIVRGKLHRADTAGEMTPIYMDVSQIQAQTTHLPTHD